MKKKPVKSSFHKNRRRRIDEKCAPLHHLNSNSNETILLVQDTALGLYAVYNTHNGQLHYCSGYVAAETYFNTLKEQHTNN